MLPKSLVLVLLSLMLISCQNQPQKTEVNINKTYLLQNLKTLSSDNMQGRFFGTAGNKKAQVFIAQQFDSLGIQTAYSDAYIREFSYTFKDQERQRIYPIKQTAANLNFIPDTTVTGANVLAMVKGVTNKTIVITGHFDHLGVKNGKIYNGADDNASGAAALITMANYFKDKTPKHSLIFAAVDAEEIGSLGAEYLVEHFPTNVEDIVLNINMDMIAHNDSLELYAAGLHHYPQLKPALDGLNSPDIKLLYGHDDSSNKLEDDWTYASDHRIFHKKEIPFIYFGVEDHKDYHQPTDNFNNINPEFYFSAVKLIINAIEAYDTTLPQ